MYAQQEVHRMSHFEIINTMRLVKTGPGLRERLEQKIARRWVVARLADFRRQLAQDMEPEPWVVLEVPAPMLLADLCDALGLDEREEGEVLGLLGLAMLEAPQPVAVRRPEANGGRALLNDRQMKALAHAESNGGIDQRTFRRLCPNWSTEPLRIDLSRLVGMGLLAKVGRKRGTRYVVAQIGN